MSIVDSQPRSGDALKQSLSGPQTKVLGKIGQNQPSLAGRAQMRSQTLDEAVEDIGVRGRRYRPRAQTSGGREATAGCTR